MIIENFSNKFLNLIFSYENFSFLKIVILILLFKYHEYRVLKNYREILVTLVILRLSSQDIFIYRPLRLNILNIIKILNF